jgi:hypothetical protein
MIISSLGQYSLKMSVGDVSWVVNPSPKQTKMSADVVLATSMHPDVHAVTQASHGESEPFVIDGPGAYEYNDIHITGVLSSQSEFSKHLSTAYQFKMDDMMVVVLGPGVQKKEGLDPQVMELCSEPDILVVAITGDSKPADIASLVVMSGPRIVVITGAETNKGFVSLLAKELSKTEPELLDKLTIKRRDLDGKQQELVILQ